MSKPLIRTAGLTRHYQMGGTLVRALDGVDLQIAPQTFTVVMGPSGSGKSTLLYLLGGLDRPTGGQIWVDEQRLDEMDENRLALWRGLNLGVIYQSFQLMPTLSLLDNVLLPMDFCGVYNPRETLLVKRARAAGLPANLDFPPALT